MNTTTNNAPVFAVVTGTTTDITVKTSCISMDELLDALAGKLAALTVSDSPFFTVYDFTVDDGSSDNNGPEGTGKRELHLTACFDNRSIEHANKLLTEAETIAGELGLRLVNHAGVPVTSSDLFNIDSFSTTLLARELDLPEDMKRLFSYVMENHVRSVYSTTAVATDEQTASIYTHLAAAIKQVFAGVQDGTIGSQQIEKETTERWEYACTSASKPSTEPEPEPEPERQQPQPEPEPVALTPADRAVTTTLNLETPRRSLPTAKAREAAPGSVLDQLLRDGVDADVYTDERGVVIVDLLYSRANPMPAGPADIETTSSVELTRAQVDNNDNLVFAEDFSSGGVRFHTFHRWPKALASRVILDPENYATDPETVVALYQQLNA